MKIRFIQPAQSILIISSRLVSHFIAEAENKLIWSVWYWWKPTAFHKDHTRARRQGRGTLTTSLIFDRRRVTRANIITPTVQNLTNIRRRPFSAPSPKTQPSKKRKSYWKTHPRHDSAFLVRCINTNWHLTFNYWLWKSMFNVKCAKAPCVLPPTDKLKFTIEMG